MPYPQILILSKPEDPHAAYVAEFLSKKNAVYSYWHFSDYPESSGLSAVLRKDVQAVILNTQTALDLSKFSAVWYRRPGKPRCESDGKEKLLKDYIEAESLTMLQSLKAMMPQAFWLSSPQAIEQGHFKLPQLYLAKQVGFNIPETYIGNDPSIYHQFFEEVDVAAIKALGRAKPRVKLTPLQKLIFSCFKPFFPKYQLPTESTTEWFNYIPLLTHKFNKEELGNLIPRLSHCPATVQKYVDKKFELRITVVGKQIFPCAIYSQVEGSQGLVDVRCEEPENIRHEAYPLPSEIEYKCFDLVRLMGLQFGCIDMIVTPDDEYVFLEINPNGQWLWIEDLTQLPIGNAIADLLVEPQTYAL